MDAVRAKLTLTVTLPAVADNGKPSAVLDSAVQDGSMSGVSGQRTGTGTNSDATLPAGDTSGVARRAANGRPSHLTDAEHARATSPEFKAKYGDWETLGHRQFLDSEPRKTLTGDEFKKDLSLPLTERVEKFYQSLGGVANSPVFGEVKLNKKGIKSSIAHGIGRNKAAAFAAVPEVIEQGRVIDQNKNWKERGYNTAVVAAPIRISNEDYVMSVVLTMDKGSSRFYVHDVYLKSRLQEGSPLGASQTQSAFKTGTIATNGTPSAPLNSVYNLVRRIYAVNPENVKISLDENGEPRMSEATADV